MPSRSLPPALPTDANDAAYVDASCLSPGQLSASQPLPDILHLLVDEVDEDTSNTDLLSHLIGQALLCRLHQQGIEAGNVYLQSFDVPQIGMFYDMAEAVPLVKAAHQIANHVQCDAMQGAEEVVLIDLGLGRGDQAIALLHELSRRDPWLTRLTIVGVDPAVDNLRHAAEALSELESSLPFAVDFVPFELLAEEFLWLGPARTGLPAADVVTVNSAFAFHHTLLIPDADHARTELLAHVRAFEPGVFTLVEPLGDHATDDVARRTRSCWRHFGAVFALIDQSALTPTERLEIKRGFFGREIWDILAADEWSRTERHELTPTWQSRLAAAGFSSVVPSPLTIELPAGCGCSVSSGLVELSFDGTPLVAVMSAKP